MAKRIRVNGVLYEAVSGRHGRGRNRRVNESLGGFEVNPYEDNQFEAFIETPYGTVEAYLFRDDEDGQTYLNLTPEDERFCFVGPYSKRGVAIVATREGNMIVDDVEETESVDDLARLARSYGLRKERL